MALVLVVFRIVYSFRDISNAFSEYYEYIFPHVMYRAMCALIYAF